MIAFAPLVVLYNSIMCTYARQAQIHIVCVYVFVC